MRPPVAAAGRADVANEELLRLLVDSVTQYAIVTTDIDGTVTSWNRGATLISGYEADEIVGTNIARLYTDEDVAAGTPDQQLAAALAEGRLEDDGWRVRKDGARVWANVVINALRGDDGRLLGFGRIVRDMSHRKRRDDALRESEERYRVLVDSITDYAIIRITKTGQVSSWNVGAERLKGYRPDEIIGQHFSVFYSAEDRRDGRPETGLREALANGRYESEGWRVRKDGSRFWANAVITPLHDADGNHVGFAKVTRDLTDRKRTEDALRGVLERERLATTRFKELDELRNELVAIVAHDIRGPLAVVRGFGELLLAEWDTTDDAEKLNLVRRTVERAGALSEFVNDVFDTARIEAGQLALHAGKVEVDAIVARVVEDAIAAAPDREIVQRVPDDLPAVWADEQRTWQILTNLVSNAVKFSPAGTPVEIEAHVEGDEAVVSVGDHGPGVAPEHQTVLFERFTRLPEAAGSAGSGIGLFIARSLAEAQGGRIWVESEPGAGSRFRFTIPLAP
jgi:PAS domain S-box-containing protein